MFLTTIDEKMDNLLWNVAAGIVLMVLIFDHQRLNCQILLKCNHQLSPCFHDRLALVKPEIRQKRMNKLETKAIP